jgi:hypothetical protein
LLLIPIGIAAQVGGRLGTGAAIPVLPTGSEWQIYLADDPANWVDGATKQTLKDWSTLANHAYRGQDVAADSTDFTLASDGGVFDGSDDIAVSTAASGWTDVTAASGLVVFKANATNGCLLMTGAGVSIALKSFGLCAGLVSGGDAAVTFHGGANNYRSAGGLIANGTWYCLIVTKAPGAINTTTVIYLNNAVVSPFSSGTGTPSIGTSNPFVLGEYYTGYFNGTIAAGMFWKRTLTPTEAGDAYVYVKSRLAASGVTLP